jgi:hypothetical protein
VDLADAGGLLTFETERALVERAATIVAGPEPGATGPGMAG